MDKLKATWSIEAAQDLRAIHGISLKIEDYIQFNKTPIPFSTDTDKIGPPKYAGVIGVYSLIDNGDMMSLRDAQIPGGKSVFLVGTINRHGGHIATDGVNYWVSDVAPIPEDGQEDIIRAIVEYSEKMEEKSPEEILSKTLATEIQEGIDALNNM